jgi:hypothetical protein
MPSAASLPAPARLLAALSRAFSARGWRWYVFGAQAVVAHGRPRLTADVDVTVELVGATARDLVTDLAPHGFELRFRLTDAILAESRLLPLVHEPTGMPLDLVIAGPGLDEEFLERARLGDVGGVEVPIVSAEDLVAMKILAGRRKDLEDVRGVLVEQRGSLDLARTRDVLASLEAAIGERTLLPRLERLLRATEPGGAKRRKR